MRTRCGVIPIEMYQAAARTPEPGCSYCFLVAEDLGVCNTGAVVDCGVDVPVAGSCMAAVAIVASSVDAPPATVRDPRQLLDIDMDQLTRGVALIAHGQWLIGGSVASIQPTQPGTAQNVLHGRGRQPNLEPDVVAPHRRFRRNWITRRRNWRRVRFGDRCGRDERSNNPDTPSATNRSRHLRTVLASTWNRSAVTATDQPCSSTHPTMRRRPSGVSGALGCWDLA